MIENVCQLYSHQEREIRIEFQFEIPLKTTFYIVLLELEDCVYDSPTPSFNFFWQIVLKKVPLGTKFRI